MKTWHHTCQIDWNKSKISDMISIWNLVSKKKLVITKLISSIDECIKEVINLTDDVTDQQ